MHARSHLGLILLAFALTAAAVAGTVLVVRAELQDASTNRPTVVLSPIPISIVFIDGTPMPLGPGVTVRDALLRADVEPRRGALLDVLGDVIDPKAVPGHVLVNGRSAPMTTVLGDGDHVTLVPGSDRTERTVRHRQVMAGRRMGDPQFSLATWHLTRVEEVGRFSGKVTSVRYVTNGPPMTPDAVALTFDDGPSPRWTPRILRILKDHDVPATFFTVGYLVERYPDLVRREVRAGMSVQNHSWDHPITPAFDDLDRDDALAEMARANRALQALGITPTLFRPPGGTFDPELVAAAESKGLRLVMWDVDPRDWATGVTTPQIIRNVLDNVRPGAIIELHDGGGDRSATVRALPRIIRGIEKLGLDVVAIS